MIKVFLGALLAIGLTFGGSWTTAQAADPVVSSGSPGLLYEFDAFSRRGVTIADNGLLEVRRDGCWNATMDVLNETDMDRSVTIIIRFHNRRGRHYTSLVVADGLDLGPVATSDVVASGCNARLARVFHRLRLHSVSRVLSVH
ncbi:MAG: hypothetical protein AAGD34_14465 [Pseudomonadota bacterium]